MHDVSGTALGAGNLKVCKVDPTPAFKHDSR